MDLTYILVDFENVQPHDMGLLSGEQYQLRIFRGPHQNKLDFEIVESLQPLGNRVKYVQSDRHGKNALDLHIAFYMGRMLQELEAEGSPDRKRTRFVVISRDGGFNALMAHIESLGYAAMKATGIRQALGLEEPEVMQTPSMPPASKEAEPVAKAKTAKPATTPKKSATAQPRPGKTAVKKPQTPVRKLVDPQERENVLEHLREHGKNRPVKRKTLERHINSLLGGNVAAEALQGLVDGLEHDGIIKFDGNKIVEYKIPKHRK